MSNQNYSTQAAREVKQNDFTSLKKFLLKHKIAKQDVDDLKSFIEDDSFDKENKKFGKKVSNWIGKMFNKAISGTWEVDQAMAPHILTESIIAYYGF